MSHIEEFHRTLLAAQGYYELHMTAEAIEELSELPETLAEHPDVMELRIGILMQAKRWKKAIQAAKLLTKIAPEKNAGHIHQAFSLHELGKTAEAREVLLNAPATLHNDPVYHYNLACYECTLGQHDEARAHLQRSVQLDKKFAEFAKSDPDLAPLRDA